MEMYNKKQKLQFIDSLPETDKSKNAYKVLFGKLYKKVEKEFDKDVAEMNYVELMVAISLLGGRDLQTIAWNISRLKQYVDWCIINGKTSILENHLNLISATDIDNSYIYRREMIKNPEHLAEMLDIVYPDAKELYLTNMYRIYFWLLYDGLTNDEAVFLKRDQVDLNNGIIHLNDRQVKINPIFYDLLKLTLPEDELISRTKNHIEKPFKLYDTEYVLRVFKATDINREKQWGSKITKFNLDFRKATGQYIKLSPIRIHESGLFYRWWLLEQQGKEIPFDEYIDTNMEDKQYAMNIVYAKTQKRKKIVAAYNKWKKAFNY